MYKLNYGTDGKVDSIQNGNMSIPICEGNTDYQEFLKWNSAQKTPLDLNSTIEVVKPEPVRDLYSEAIGALAKEIDGLKDRLETNELKVEALEVVSIK